jgi:hypothetical protein
MRERFLAACSRHAQVLCGWLLCLVLCASLVSEAARPSGPMVDEAEWITAGYVAWQLLAAGAPPARWERAFDERKLGDWGNKNPPLGKYIIGLAAARHVRDPAAVQYRLQFMRPLAGQARVERMPPVEVLTSARLAIALCACACLVALYLLALELTGRSVWASIAPLGLFLLPGFQHHAVRVYTDAPELALLGFASLYLVRFARSHQLLTLGLSAICAGLACAVKLSAGAWCLGAGAYLAAAALRDPRARLSLVLSALLSLASFVAVNPYLYADPWGRTLGLVHDWSASKARQQADPRLADTAVRDPLQRVHHVTARGVFAPASTPHIQSLALNAFFALLPLCLGLAAISGAALWISGWQLTLRGPPRALALDCAYALCGCALERLLSSRLTFYGGAAALGLAWLARSARRQAPARAFACVFFATWIATSLWLPFDWARYYLPVASLSAVLYALAAHAVAQHFALERGPAWVRHASLGSGLALGVTALAALAFGWALISIVTPPLLP